MKSNMKWPYLTDPSLAISGQFKSNQEDFKVEEIPLYLPSGNGEHLYALIEKKGITTDQLIQKLSRSLGIKAQHIGHAGKKDRFGVTQQWISLLNVKESELLDLQIPGVTIIETAYHRNKLRPGHLKGNRFHITLRDVKKDAQHIVEQILNKLDHSGLPNYFGSQRFGIRGDNPAVGLALLNKDWQMLFRTILGNPGKQDTSIQIYQARQLFEEGQYQEALELWPQNQSFARSALRHLLACDNNFERAAKRLPKHRLHFYINSLQSFWFNESLAHRLPHIDEIWEEELAYLHRNAAVFRVEHADIDQQRAKNFEISPSGPIWGYKMILPGGKAFQLEHAVLQSHHIGIDDAKQKFRHWRIPGERRSYRVPLKNISCQQQEDALSVQFELPPGSYATVVIRELLKDNYAEVVPKCSAEQN